MQVTINAGASTKQLITKADQRTVTSSDAKAKCNEVRTRTCCVQVLSWLGEFGAQTPLLFIAPSIRISVPFYLTLGGNMCVLVSFIY
jgi:hypothetical protein